MGLFDFVDSVFDPTSGFAGDLIEGVAGSILGGFSNNQPSALMPTYQPVSYGGFGAPAAVYPTAASVPMAARAIAAGMPAWSARFPSLWQALQKLRASGSRATIEQLYSMLRRWGPTALSTVIGAAAVADLVSYRMQHKRRRMNPANPKALRRSMRRLKSFDTMASRVKMQLATSCHTRRRKKC